jgi:hypothetical protein
MQHTNATKLSTQQRIGARLHRKNANSGTLGD